MRIDNEYDGESGIYACLRPVVPPPVPVISTINRLPITWEGLAAEDYHVTVVFDSSARVSREDLSAWLQITRGVPETEAFRAVPVSKPLWWTNKDSVYLGLEMYCPEAFALHEEMKATLGIKSSFPSYKCHLTYGRWKGFPPSIMADIGFMNDFVSRSVSAEVPPILELSSLEMKNAKD